MNTAQGGSDAGHAGMLAGMADRFQNSRSRLDRAYLHARAFDAEWTALFKQESPSPDIRKDRRAGWHVVCARLSPAFAADIKRNQLALTLGEFAYQLRASLDGLIWDAITYTQGAEPPANANRLEFPILNGKDRDFRKCAFHSFPFPQGLSDWMESIQPGTAAKLPGDPDRGLQDALEDIHNLARYDRHRRLRVVGVFATKSIVEVETDPPGGSIVEHEWLPCDLFDGKYEFVRLKVVLPGGLMPYLIRLKTSITFEIEAEDVPLFEGENIGVQMTRFLHAVAHVVSRFEREFETV